MDKKLRLSLKRKEIVFSNFYENVFCNMNIIMKNKTRRLYIPAMSIAVIVLILFMVIGVSTYRNLNRDRSTIVTFVERQGLGVLKSIEAGIELSRSSLSDNPDIERLFSKISEIDDVSYIYITGSDGKVIYRSGNTPDDIDYPGLESIKVSGGILKKVVRHPDNRDIFQMVKAYFPPGVSPDHSGVSPENVITIGLFMSTYEESIKADIHHAIIMASILLVLGSGLIFFIFVIQNYYMVDKSLKQTRDYTRQVIANMANGLVSVNNSGNIVSFNKLALELLELEEEKADGLDLSEIIDFESSGITEILNGRTEALEKEITITRRSNESLPLSLSVAPIFLEDGKIDGAVIIVRDLREIKRLQEKVKRSEKLAAIGKLSAGVAHEIRNPLSSIKGFAQFLRHVLKDRPEESEYANVMVHEIDRINRVVNDLLIYSKPFEVKRKKLDLNEVVDHTLLLAHADAQEKKVNIVKKMPEDLKDLWLDANQITQALLNLLLNSLEAVSVGGKIDVGAELVDQKQVHIWVEDDGYGIPDGYQEKIMDPFYTTRDKGTGLGLAIVHKIVENHNGEIKVISPPPGKSSGTLVSMLIPLNINYEAESKQ